MMHIAIFGCGQLAQMIAQAGIEQGYNFSFIAQPGEDSRCVDELGKIVECTEDMNAWDLYEALGRPDVITVEKEMVNTQLLASLKEYTAVYPDDEAVFLSQNRVREKNFLRHHAIPTADFEVIETEDQLLSLPERLGYPIYIKAAESGYDGYNQWRIQSEADLNQVTLKDDVVLIAERHVDYSREVSLIAARNSSGDIVYYPLMENRHEKGVLISTIAPAPGNNEELEKSAVAYMETLLTSINYVGVLTMECFDTSNGLVVNELAPRVHNSGHWSIEGCETSQFKNHCLAITDATLGATSVTGLAGMVNMLGQHGTREDFSESFFYYHDYGKTQRARRKLGHVTTLSDNLNDLKNQLNKTLVALYGDDYQPLK